MSMRVGDESARAAPNRSTPICSRVMSATTPDRNHWRVALRRFARHKLAVAALVFLVFMVLACWIGARFAPSPTEQHLLEPPSSPSWSHWFGTDELSRDEFSRVLHGGQVSLRVGSASRAC